MDKFLFLFLAIATCFLFSFQPASSHSIWEGTWHLYIGKGGNDRTLKCGYYIGSVEREFAVTLHCPDYASDEYGNHGYWTTSHFYGVDIVIQGRKFYSFPYKRGMTNGSLEWYNYMSVGWSHDLLGNNWACFYGRRVWNKDNDAKPERENEQNEDRRPGKGEPPIAEISTDNEDSATRRNTKPFKADMSLISRINAGQSLWKAEIYPEFQNLTEDDMTNLAGGKLSLKLNMKYPEPSNNISEEMRKKSLTLPMNFDWRNFNGISYVSPVRNQGHCGSCYAFASTAMHESRMRILTDNAVSTVYSPQDVVDCSPYDFGCYGGVGLSNGKFAEDFGFAEETCKPYEGRGGYCSSLSKCRRSYATDYEYVGGYFGACNEVAMRLAIYQQGPIVVGYTVFTDFFYYRSGIYYHWGPDRVAGGHAVTIVGWGADPRSGTRYWIVKNSWGTNWGENGYFRIIRGLNACGIESRAWHATPIL